MFYILCNRISKQQPRMIILKNKKVNEDYKFVKELGRGSSGICFKAALRANPETQRCIKRIKKQTLENNELPKQVAILDQLAHPDIIRLYDVFEDDKAFYLVTDLCEDGDLFDYLDCKGALSEHDAKQIFIQIVSAVKYCHFKKIAHRDLKPENFLIIQNKGDQINPKLKLIDFDLSFQWSNNMRQQILDKEGRRIIGTPYYIAPEVLSGKYDARCDIWSMGVILFILVTGCPPFSGNTPQEIFKQIQKMNIDYEIAEMQEVSLLLKDLINKMLSPVQQRIGIDQIMNHPWMRIESKKTKLQVDYKSMIQFSKFSKLKQITANYLSMQMTTSELKQHEELFRILDQNNDGFLSVEELRVGLSQKNGKDSEFAVLLDFVEVDSQGLMNYNDFLASFVTEKTIKCRENLRYVYDRIDTNCDGFISRDELEVALKRYGLKRKPFKAKNMNEDSSKIFSDTDKNHDGIIDFEQFALTIINEVEL